MNKNKKIISLPSLIFFIILILAGTVFVYRNEITTKCLLFYADYNLKNKNFETSYKIYNSLSEYLPDDSDIKEKMTVCLCNMPFYYSIQKKLLETAQSDDGSKAEKLATDAVLKFRKKIFKKFGDNYTKEMLFNNMVLRWSQNSFPLNYSVKGDSETPDYYLTAAKDVFNDWQRESDDFITFKPVSNEAGAKIVIRFKGNAQNLVTEPNEAYEAGVTKPVIEKERYLKQMKINVLNKTHNNEFFTKEQIKTLLTHEIGHALGLCGHTKDNSTIMYYSLDNDYDLYQNRIDTSLTKKDMNTLKLLYNLAPDVTDNPKDIEENEKYFYHRALFDALDNSKDIAVREAMEQVKVNPGNLIYSLSLSDAYTADGKYKESIDLMLLLLEQTDDAKLLNVLNYNIANNYILLKDFDKALLYANEALKINNGADNRCLVAYVKLLKGDIDEAEKLFIKILSKYPSNVNASLGLADVYIQKKQYLNARKILKQLVRLKPEIVNDKNFARYKIYVMF